jgi:hypothetical protein
MTMISGMLTYARLIQRINKLTVYAGRDFGELFDLKNDPDERNNLWSSPRYGEIKLTLIKKLADE